MRRANTVLVAFAVLAVACVPAALSARSTSADKNSSRYGYGYDVDPHFLRWAIVSHGNTSNSDMESLDDIERLKGDYGDEFLYIRQDDDRYVIRDHAMVERAYRALEPMQEAGREIGEAVGAKVGRSFSMSEDGREQARMARRIARLSRKIAKLSADGEDTRDLEREQARLRRELDEMREKSDRGSRESREAEADLDARTEKASKHMKDAAKHLKHEIREIFDEAKARHLAERVE